jgi:hypothetical protein
MAEAVARPSAMQRRLQAGALALGLVAIAGPALAQSASERAGLRTLTWPGKAETPASAPDRPRPQPVPTNTPSAPLAEPPRIQPSRLPDYTAVAPSFPQGLTPATAFGVPPVAGGGQAYASAPVPYAAVAEQGGAAVRPTPVPQTRVPSTPVPQTPVSARQDESADPLAPRRDAAIWRLTERGTQGRAETAPSQPNQPAPQSSTSDRDGARYYSVHREAGRAPDPTTLPAPFFLDSAPVDLAEPPPPPTLTRNQGGLAPSVAGDAL